MYSTYSSGNIAASITASGNDIDGNGSAIVFCNETIVSSGNHSYTSFAQINHLSVK